MRRYGFEEAGPERTIGIAGKKENTASRRVLEKLGMTSKGSPPRGPRRGALLGGSGGFSNGCSGDVGLLLAAHPADPDRHVD